MQQQAIRFYVLDTQNASLGNDLVREEIIASGLWERILIELEEQDVRFVSGTDATVLYRADLSIVPVGASRETADFIIRRIASRIISRIDTILASGAARYIFWTIKPNYAPPAAVHDTLVELLAPLMLKTLNSQAMIELDMGHKTGHDILETMDTTTLNGWPAKDITLTLRKEHVAREDFPVKILEWFDLHRSFGNALRIYPRLGSKTIYVQKYIVRKFKHQIAGGELFEANVVRDPPL